jgi:hypothetical protein
MDEISKLSRESEKQALERQAAELSAAFAAKPLPKLHPVDSTQTSTASPIGHIPAKPRIDRAEALDAKTFDKGISDLNKFLENVTDIEQLVNEVMSFITEQSDPYLEAQKKLLERDKAYAAKQENERAKATDAEMEANSSADTWGTVSQTVSTISLLAVSLSIAPSPLALAGAVVAVSKLCDLALDDMFKKKIASWLAQGNGESQKAWVERIHLFSEVFSVGLSFHLMPQAAMQLAMNIVGVATTATTATRSVAEYRATSYRALREELAENCRVAHKSIEKTIETMYESCDTTRHLQQMTHQIDEGRVRLSHLLLRPISS